MVDRLLLISLMSTSIGLSPTNGRGTVTMATPTDFLVHHFSGPTFPLFRFHFDLIYVHFECILFYFYSACASVLDRTIVFNATSL